MVSWLLCLSLGLQFTTDGHVKGCTPDPVMNAKYLRELYLQACSSYSGVFSVPMLWDKKLGTIVCNESEDLMRMMNSELNDFARNPGLDLYPVDLREQVDDWNTKTMGQLMKMPKSAGDALTQQECTRIQD